MPIRLLLLLLCLATSSLAHPLEGLWVVKEDVGDFGETIEFQNNSMTLDSLWESPRKRSIPLEVREAGEGVFELRGLGAQPRPIGFVKLVANKAWYWSADGRDLVEMYRPVPLSSKLVGAWTLARPGQNPTEATISPDGHLQLAAEEELSLVKSGQLKSLGANEEGIEQLLLLAEPGEATRWRLLALPGGWAVIAEKGSLSEHFFLYPSTMSPQWLEPSKLENF